jgi:membrane protein involved in colicin uptake
MLRCSGAVHFRQSEVTQQSDDSGLTLNIWQRMIERYKASFIHEILRRFQSSEQYAGVDCMVNINPLAPDFFFKF